METKILVIEDDAQSMYIFKTLLNEQGYQVIGANDGHAGLEAARQANPHLILLDIVLPGGMDGYSVAKKLRENPAMADIPILAVSSLPLMSNEQHALAAGCNAYIEKPIDMDRLLQQIREFLPVAD